MSLKVYEAANFSGGGTKSNTSNNETLTTVNKQLSSRQMTTLPILKTVRLKAAESTTSDENNVAESDLTELSWLTSNVSAMLGQQQQQQQQRYPQPFNLPLVQQPEQYNSSTRTSIKMINDDDQIAPSSSTSPAPSSNNPNGTILSGNAANSAPFSPLSSSSASSISSSSSSYASDHSTGRQIVSNKQKLKTAARFKAQQQQQPHRQQIHHQYKPVQNQSESRHHYHNYLYNNSNNQAMNQSASKSQEAVASTVATSTLNEEESNKRAKPALTLSCLIFMALHESPNECLPVREIYEWIEANFPFYRSCSNTGWKSSIRHNLSFSKCFRKMDRTELVFYRSSKDTPIKLPMKSSDYLNISGRKKRAPNSVGTCWKVNAECKSFLIHTLKRSAFWTKNSASYPKICELIREHDSSPDFNSSRKNSHHNYLINPRIRVETQPKEDYDMMEETTTDEENNEMNDNLHEFVQNEHGLRDLKPLHSPSSPSSSSTTSPNTALRSSLDTNKQLDLSFSSSTSSLFANSSCFQSANRPPLTPESINADDDEVQCAKRRKTTEATDLSNSDLEIEVASTLVGMKWLFKNKK